MTATAMTTTAQSIKVTDVGQVIVSPVVQGLSGRYTRYVRVMDLTDSQNPKLVFELVLDAATAAPIEIATPPLTL